MNAPIVKLVRHDDVAVIEIDHKPVNALSKAVRQGLLDALAGVADDPLVSAVVIHGGEGCFIAGADIKELTSPPEAPFLPDVIARIDALAKPVIAAIDGAALGGGLEIALACDRRIASPRSTFALPETRLGLIPGAGGTQRLPRLIGIELAEILVATGEALKAERALGIGLVDAVLDDPLRAAIAQACVVPKRRLSAATVPQKHAVGLSGRFPQTEPAVAAAIALVKETLVLPFKDGLAREREIFLKLRESSHAQARIHLFLAGKAAFRFPSTSVGERRVASVAIAGSGTRARAIAALLCRSGVAVNTDDSGLREADLIIDALDNRKAHVTARRLASLSKPGAIIATTRSRNLDRLANVAERHSALIGLHFRLSNGRSLVEVVPTARTAPETVNAVLGLIRKTGAQAVVTRQAGLVGQRIIVACRAAAGELRRSGVSHKDIKAALVSCGASRSLGASALPRKSTDPALRHRLLGEMAREAAALVSEGIVRHSFDVDLILVHGYGFPHEDGGPIWASGTLENDGLTLQYGHSEGKVRA
ncbi:bifunctional 3-hydroxyacyl-CoA dehydrogenase/crotonase protein (plasmid) [Rhizobium gallicum]|uniref:Bifunctional 3-hydroxyacyl-CoA dehydrogenase/crotonase protein n=1 Tax=Rhizobium gallicum TaxID=56730 RepID=A0A1L5NRJ2_9HYPH|nr:enoyl-CoA hydratase-related protein [Rhizobium gallicum]APO70492.1 bifunctional 3-hydroxyacyl-CoA dehydrogenase/crotonase protein [Rhizobium gallicum]